jgi:predicted nucleic acid-binding protein
VILVDTSVWIDHFRDVESPEALRLLSALEAEEDLCICGVVLTEVLQGIRDGRQFRAVKAVLSGLLYLPMTRDVFVLAAGIYRSAREDGKTIRNTVDCMIAACAVWHRVPLLHKDRDFLIIAQVSPLEVLKP